MKTLLTLTLTFALVLVAAPVIAQDLPRGRIIDAVVCAGDPTQTYALYLPSNYTPDRPWPLLMGFNGGARGRAMVETYQAAAEQYGYIVVGSNNSRNGLPGSSNKAVTAMTADIGRRFPVASGRFYMAGMSGGSRVAFEIALASGKVNGIIASAAGFHDSTPRKSVPFVVFGTVGTEDYDYVEMKMLDMALKTPHKIVVFEGGHQLPPAPVAMQAIEWLEVQAMAVGTRARDQAIVDRLFAKWLADAESERDVAAKATALDELANDFATLTDVTALRARVDAMKNDKVIKRALSQARADTIAESNLMTDLMQLEGRLFDETTRADAMQQIRERLSRAYKRATAPDESPERQQARRVILAINSGAAERIQDREYLAMLATFRLPTRARGRGGM